MNNSTLANTTLLDLDATKHAFADMVNITTLNSTTTCALSPHARAVSSVLTGFVGTILTGLSSGSHVVSMVSWICWFPSLRIVIVSFYQVYSVFRLDLPEGGEHFFKFLDQFYHHDLRGWHNEFFRGAVVAQVSFLGWMGWIYTTLYSPTIQVMWLQENWGEASTGLKFARAIGVGVAALPSTFDTRARYGQALGRIGGWPAAWLFAALTAASTTTLAGVLVIELGLVASELAESAQGDVIFVLYVVYTLFWTYHSLVFASPHDEAKDVSGGVRILAGAVTGAFQGLLVAAPAFGVMMSAPDHPGVGLSAYLRCEGTTWWQKLVAILP
ncbi:hypothetical protein BP6252_13234 [Coleophoma cylindrospora]|uniref:Uncharacterized protein n=1 Tax=Coleophoma cylindrospora TaxID=1849047 RepID=A0A3D8QAW7_9HELO|nr:hypothetical protein BP6252_13234 [Coleophoma cylindrospora]